MDDMEQIQDAVLKGQVDKIVALVQSELTRGTSAKKIIDNGLIAGMEKVAALFKKNEIYIPEVLVSAKSMHIALDVLKPILEESDKVNNMSLVAIGTVRGDMHDIGKNLVIMMLRGAGYQVKDLGVDQPPESFVTAAVEEGAQIIGLSCLLTTTMPKISEVIAALIRAEARKKVKVIVGGAPISASFAKSAGADGYAPDAGSAVDLVKNILSEKS